MKWSNILLVLFDLFVVAASTSLIESSCKDLENAKLQIGSTEVECGNYYTLDKINAPSSIVTFEGAKKDKLYLIAMVDPDAPSPDAPQCRSWLHFIQEDLPGTDLASGKFDGDTVTDYKPPTPPKGSGKHRYFVFIFEQKGKLSLSNPNSRCGFNIDEFAENNHLTPIAMNMFETNDN